MSTRRSRLLLLLLTCASCSDNILPIFRPSVFVMAQDNSGGGVGGGSGIFGPIETNYPYAQIPQGMIIPDINKLG